MVGLGLFIADDVTVHLTVNTMTPIVGIGPQFGVGREVCALQVLLFFNILAVDYQSKIMAIQHWKYGRVFQCELINSSVKLFCDIVAQAKCIFVKFCSFVGNLYPHVFTVQHC